MKRTIGLVAAVILLGAFVVACSQKPAEPASTPATSPAPAATEEPAASPEPTATPEAESTADDDEPATHEDLVEMITEKLGYTEEEAEKLIQEVEEWDEAGDASLDAAKAARNEEFIQDYMEFGFTREEAEAKCEEIEKRGTAARIEEGVRMRISSIQEQERIEREFAESAEATNNYYLERYGITKEEAMGKSSEELNELFNQKHGG